MKIKTMSYKKMPKIATFKIDMGCDPEFFFEKDGKIIGSEKILPINGGLSVQGGLFIVDGVQGEFNTAPSRCREILRSQFGVAFKQLSEHLEAHPGVTINWKPTVKIEQEELNTLSDKAKMFGCAPSRNAAMEGMQSPSINASEYLYRSAGGHIHIGNTSEYSDPRLGIALSDPLRLVNILDIMVGNTCVLLDRDEGNIIRREIYGRAGEFRTPRHGIEYRTLSNFWLRSYPLMSLVFGLVRTAVAITGNSSSDFDYAGQLMKLVDIDEIRRAINENDFKLAQKNFKKIEKFITDHFEESLYYSFPLTASRLPLFKHFVKKGMDHWFKDDPIKHWTETIDGSARYLGWENFALGPITSDMNKKEFDLSNIRQQEYA